MTQISMREKKMPGAVEGNDNAQTEEVTAFCPQCKALQTVWLNRHVLMPTRKFTQVENRIYHNCGSKEPCRLYYEF